MTPRPAGVVLAGGRSRRFGRDKASEIVAGQTLLDRVVAAVGEVAEPVVVVGGPGLPDLEPGGGPLQAALAGWAAVGEAPVLLAACDLPGLTAKLLAPLLEPLPPGVDARAPLLDDRPQYLCAFYGPRAKVVFEAARAASRRSLAAAVAELTVDWLGPEVWRARGLDPAGLRDADTPAELAELLRRPEPPLTP